MKAHQPAVDAHLKLETLRLFLFNPPLHDLRRTETIRIKRCHHRETVRISVARLKGIFVLEPIQTALQKNGLFDIIFVHHREHLLIRAAIFAPAFRDHAQFISVCPAGLAVAQCTDFSPVANTFDLFNDMRVRINDRIW